MKSEFFSRPDAGGIPDDLLKQELSKASSNVKSSNEPPRRINLQTMHEAEKAILNAMQEVEKVGASTGLTNAIVRLQEARNLVGDFIDGVEPKVTPHLEGSYYPNVLFRKPVIGDVVVFFPNPDDAVGRGNTAKVCPAIITRIWGATGTCNLKLIPDHAPMQDRGSVSHKSGNISNYSWCFQEEFQEGIRHGLWAASEF